MNPRFQVPGLKLGFDPMATMDRSHEYPIGTWGVCTQTSGKLGSITVESKARTLKAPISNRKKNALSLSTLLILSLFSLLLPFGP